MGTFTLNQIRHVLNEAIKIGTIEWVFFEGGEPFLYYPIMIEGLKLAKELGFKTGVVTNSYWATSVEDAELWLKPISEIGISIFSISDDTVHYGNEILNLSKKAEKAVKNLNMPSSSICIEEPAVEFDKDQTGKVLGRQKSD